MILELAIGTALILWTVLMTAVALWLADGVATRRFEWMRRPSSAAAGLALFLSSVLWLLLVMTFAIWSWAIVFLILGVFKDLETAIYFATTAFTTLGIGDVLMPEEWRLLGGMAAANGFLLFGLMAAILVDALRVARRGLDRPPRD